MQRGLHLLQLPQHPRPTSTHNQVSSTPKRPSILYQVKFLHPSPPLPRLHFPHFCSRLFAFPSTFTRVSPGHDFCSAVQSRVRHFQVPFSSLIFAFFPTDLPPPPPFLFPLAPSSRLLPFSPHRPTPCLLPAKETTTARPYRFITASTGEPSTLLTTCSDPSQCHSEPLQQQAQWLPLVKNLQLMSNCHHEDDAQLCVHSRRVTASFAA